MSDTVAVLTEEALQPSDVTQIVALYTGRDVDFLVLVPADTVHNPVLETIDYLSVGEFDEAREVRETARSGGPEADVARREAACARDASVGDLRAAGAEVTSGHVVADDPLPALVQAVTNLDVREIVVVTRPHPIEDALHRDWASRARRELPVPVIHFWGGTNHIVD